MFYTRKEEVTDDALALALLAGTGENPLDAHPDARLGASESRSIEGKPHSRVWFSTTVVHYTGNGLWTVGFAPHPLRSKNARWQWIHDLSGEAAHSVLAENRNRIVRCNTEEVRQILRDCP